MAYFQLHILRKILVLFVFFLIIHSCKNDDLPSKKLILAYQMVSDKTWYLDYSQFISNSGVKTRNYLGQSTYFISLLKDKTTADSDGIIGNYFFEISNDGLIININGKTKNGTTVSYAYNVESIGSKNFIARYKESDTMVVKQFFSAK